jgi:regulator of sirC expression with transglutaminase-like and TPR domain
MPDDSKPFSADPEFLRLVGRSEEVDLLQIALEIARDADPELDFAPTLAWVTARGHEVARAMASCADDRDCLAQLGQRIAGEHGITGAAEAYETADGSFVNRAIETGRGIPICVSVLYMAVARAAGIDLCGVCSPGHFVTRYETLDEPLFVDAFSAGQVLTRKELVERLAEQTGIGPGEILPLLAPATNRAIVIRILNNLKALYARTEAWPRAYRVQQRLTALQPAHFGERRDLGFVALKAGRPAEAIRLLEACLRSAPKEERPLIEASLRTAHRGLAQFN